MTTILSIARNALVVSVASIVCNAAALAGTYAYFPNSPLFLGANFDPTALNEARLPCIQFTTEIQREKYKGNDNGARGGGTVSPRQTQFDLSQIKSRESLYKHLNISASISGSYGFFSGSGSFELESENTFGSDSFTWIVRAYTKFGDFGIDETATLNPTASQILKRSRTAFEARCGTEYVSQITRAALVAVVYTVKNVAQSEMQRLEAQFKASYDTGFWGVEGGASYKSFFESAKQVGTMEVHVYALGGDGVTSLSDLVTSTDDINKVRQAMKKYLDNLTVDKSAVTEYLTGSLKQFAPNLPDVVLDTYNRRIGELWLLREDLLAERQRLVSFVRASADYSIDANTLKMYKDRISELSKSLVELEDTARQCRLINQRVKIQAMLGAVRLDKETSLPSTKVDAENYPPQQQMNLLSVANQSDVSIVSNDNTQINIGTDCPFNASYTDISPELLPPPYPFSIDSWTDTFGTAPKKYMFSVIRSPKISSVRLIDSGVPPLTLATPPVVPEGNDVRVAVKLELDNSITFPIRAIVTMRSGRMYPALLLDSMPR